MSTGETTPWLEANQRYLWQAVVAVREMLERHIARTTGACIPERQGAEAGSESVPDMGESATLETVCSNFGLSSFERSVLVLCAGMELDSTFVELCSAAQGDTTRPFPTFSLALAVLPDAHWSAIVPGAALRHWRLVEVGTGSALTLSPLRIDEWVLHYLVGIQHLDERLESIVWPVSPPEILVPSHRAHADRLAAIWTQATAEKRLPPVQLCGTDSDGKRAIAAAACAALNLNLYAMQADVLPSALDDLETLTRLWTREAALHSCALLLTCDAMDASDATREKAVSYLIERIGSPLIVSVRDRRRTGEHPLLALDVERPTRDEQRFAWQGALGPFAANGTNHVDDLVSQFNLSADTIRMAGAEALGQMDGENGADAAQLVWDACRVHARPRLDDLAQCLEVTAGWDDLILPELQHQILREIAVHVRQRTTVYERWGFSAQGTRGLGISALFAGASGTGKTLAAEVLADALRLDLYRIDLSSVVSKYIGETEKNLRRVFDAAEDGGAILLFDEADALFGKRSEVKDSHDRYANIEVSYLLQRMEAYRGLAILTTNMKRAIDPAFLRRIRFIVQFPFPDATHRAQIWRRIFPPNTPTEGLDVEKLARLNVAGGNIRNIALNAAFLAAGAVEPVRMPHLLRAAHTEYAKLEKPLTGAETGGWI